MQTRLKKVKEVIVDWFKGHGFVKAVNFGDFIQMYMSNQLEHSSLVIDLIAVPEITRSKVGYQFLITYTDRLYPDRRNLDEIKNDTIRVFQDFIIAVNNDANLRQYITGLTSSGVQMFTQATKDLVAGGVMTVTLNIFSEQNVCEIPVNVTPQPTPSCPDGFLELLNSQGTLLDTISVESGLTVQYTAPDGQLTIEDQNGNVLGIENVPSGASEVAVVNVPQELFWQLNFNDTDDTAVITVTADALGTLVSGSGVNVGTIEVSTDNVNFVALSFPFVPVLNETYFFKRSDTAVSGVFTLIGSYV